MQIKPGVQMSGVHYMLWWAAAVYDYVHQASGYGEATITGGMEPASGRVNNTQHPQRTALDFRTWAVPASELHAFATRLQRSLGAAFDVVVERDHIHVELAPAAWIGAA